MTDPDRTTLPIRRQPFQGVANRTLDGSRPDWDLIGHPEPPGGAPNVLLVLVDDAGFGNPSTFGGPIRTPNYTRLADGGLRYNRFHVTALCSPTRASLLTGRNNHAVGFGSIGEFSSGFPGYTAVLPRDCAPLPRIMRDNGYATAAFGKWHLTPDDNGASMEGTITGSFNELTMQNGIPLSDEMQLQLTERYGGIGAWGTPALDPHYSAAWAWAGNTPFKWGKQVGSHLGGTRDPMIVRLPARVSDPGALRRQFTHVTDVAPTILDVAGIPAPATVDGIAQEPMHGTAFTDSLADPDAPEHHTQQYFETIGNRAMYKDGWWLAMRTPRVPWVVTPEALRPYAPGVWDPDADPVELYHLPDDFTQARDVAAGHPEKVAELRELFWREAEKYKVLPLLATLSAFFGILPPLRDESRVEYRGDVQNVMPGMIPRIYNHSYTISADLVVPPGGGGPALRRLPARRGRRGQGHDGRAVGGADRPHGPRGRRRARRARVRGRAVRAAAAGRHRGRRGGGAPRPGAEGCDRRRAAQDGRQRYLTPGRATGRPPGRRGTASTCGPTRRGRDRCDPARRRPARTAR
jgi:arylsulfatase A-like enzyme